MAVRDAAGVVRRVLAAAAALVVGVALAYLAFGFLIVGAFTDAGGQLALLLAFCYATLLIAGLAFGLLDPGHRRLHGALLGLPGLLAGLYLALVAGLAPGAGALGGGAWLLAFAGVALGVSGYLAVSTGADLRLKFGRRDRRG